MRINKTLISAISIPVVIGGWALFRPELLFINQQVNETLPVHAQDSQTVLADGSFRSEAHETKGTAEIVRSGGKTYLQLKNFSTSNGPDVRVYLTTGGNPGKGSLPLGALKGNIGMQNYELPAGYDATQHSSVSIWCERFAVGFGSARLKPAIVEKTAQSVLNVSNISFESQTEVTFGSVAANPKFIGRGALLENEGKRWAEIRFSKFAPGSELRLVKKETLSLGAFPANAPFVKLNKPNQKGNALVSVTPLDKQIDLWLYRTIAILDAKSKRIISFINLRSAQESKPNSAELNLI